MQRAAAVGFTAIQSASPAKVPALRGCLFGIAAVALLTALKLGVPALSQSTPFLAYFAAILLAAWSGGLVAGLVTVGVAAVAANYFFVPPFYSFSLTTHGISQVVLFVFEGALTAGITARLRDERRRSAASADDAKRAVGKLRAVLSGVDAGITVQDRTGQLVYANEPAAAIIGFDSVDELLGTPVSDLVARFEILTETGDPFPIDELPSRVVLSGGKASERLMRFRTVTSGEERWSMVNATPIRSPAGEVEYAVNVFRDVTDKLRHQEALRVSQEWFGTALRSIGDAVIATERDGTIGFLNPAACELTGWTASEATGRQLGDVFSTIDERTRARIPTPVERVIAEGTAAGQINQTLLVRRDGSELAIDDSAAPIRDSGGAMVGAVLVFRDVSARRRQDTRRAFLTQAGEELGSSLDTEVTLATVARLAVPAIADWCAVDLIEDGQRRRVAVAHVDPDKVRLVEELERRYPADPAQPRGAWNIIRTGAPEMIADLSPAVVDETSRDTEHRELLHRLSLRSYIGVPIRRGDSTIGVITLVMAESNRQYDAEDLDVAMALGDRASAAVERAMLFREIDQARREAATQRDRLHRLIMAAPAAICIQRGGRHEYELVNEPYRQLFGGRDLVGTAAAAVGVDTETLRMLDAAVASGKPVVAREHAVTAEWDDSGGPTARYFNQTIQPLRDSEGGIEGTVTFAVEVTDQVTARRELELANAEAELANRSKDEFLAMLGHELRNPLAPILTALQLMKLRAGDALDRERTIIDRQVRHVVRLVDDLLDVSRITRGKIELAREPVEISEVVAKAIEMASPLFEQRKQDVQVSLEPRMRVVGDPIRLAQVMANILNNAAKYTERGGQIRITGRRVGNQVRLTVRDSGIGIAADMLPRIFGLFIQEKQALDRAQGGLGLGLAIARSLVALHGGTIHAHSRGIGHGSEFVVELPRLRRGTADSTAPAPAVLQPIDNPRAVKVLVVDDNEDALGLLADGLELLGHETFRASDGPAALRIAANEAPAVALLDIGLPVMDGYELAQRLRQLRGLERIKLVALTGYGQDADRARAAAAGFDVHLVKPVTMETVQEAIDGLIA